jgi:hypothetical protein
MTAKPITPAEAKAVWHMLEKPSSRKVADWFHTAGRPVSHQTIWEWKRAGWPGTSAAGIAKAAGAALAKIDGAVATLGGDLGSAMAVVPNAAKAAQKKSEPNGRKAERAEEALFAAITGAMTMWERIRDIASAVPSEADADARPVLLLGAPDGIAKLMMASSAAINMAIEGLRQLLVLQAEETAALPGTQTVYLPGQGPHADSPQPSGSHEEEDPERSAMDALDEVLREIRERGPLNADSAAPRDEE